MKRIESERIYLRPFEKEDAHLLYALDSNPEVMKHIGDYKREPMQVEAYNKGISRIVQYYAENPGLGIWVTCLKENDQSIGWTSLKDLDGSEYIEIGYRYLPEFWGKGYATEICRALLEYGFSQLNLNEIVAITVTENYGSKRVMEKLGLAYKRMDHYYDTDVVFYELTKSQYKEMKSI